MRHASCGATAVTNDGEVTIRNTTRRRGLGGGGDVSCGIAAISIDGKITI